MNYLMDLERTLLTGYAVYWKPNKHGYTRDLRQAGLYSDEEANEIVAYDFDERTVKIPYQVVKNLFRWEA